MKIKFILIELESDDDAAMGNALTEMLEVAFPASPEEAALSAHETKEG